MRKLLLTLLFLLALSRTASAAITLGNISNSDGVSGSSTTITFAATVQATGFLCVVTLSRDLVVDSVTFNGDALTKRVEQIGSNDLVAAIWTITTPDVGTFNVVINNTGAATYMAGVAVEFLGVDTTSPVDATDSEETTGANPAFVGFSTVTDGAAVIDGVATNSLASPITMNAETNRVQRANFLADDQGRYVGVSTIITKTTAGTITGGWGIDSNNSAYVGLALKPATAPPPSNGARGGMLLLGVGE